MKNIEYGSIIFSFNEGFHQQGMPYSSWAASTTLDPLLTFEIFSPQRATKTERGTERERINRSRNSLSLCLCYLLFLINNSYPLRMTLDICNYKKTNWN